MEPYDLVISLDYFPLIGGAHTWMHEVYKRWPRPVQLLARDYGDDQELGRAQMAFDSHDHANLHIHRISVNFKELSLFHPACIRSFNHLIRTVKAIAPGHQVRIHSLRAFPEGIAAWVYKKTVNRKAKTITYVHGEELNVADTSRQLRFFTRQVLSGSDLIIVNSKATLDRLKDFMVVDSPVQVIHPGVDALAFRVPSASIARQRKKWECKPGQIVLVTVARMEPRKNHANVIRALALLRQNDLDLTYVIAGGGDQREKLVRLAASLGVERHVRFTGVISRKEKIAAFGAADIHVMASVEYGLMVEGFGIVFIEAAAAGVPSIGGCSGGQAEAVVHGETGLIVNGEDLGQLSEAIRYLAENKSVRNAMGRKGRLFALENDWEEVVRKTVQSVEALM